MKNTTIMTIRSRAPLRLGLAGGGTDVSPFSDTYGGAVLNATISLFAYAHIEIDDDHTAPVRGATKPSASEVVLECWAQDRGERHKAIIRKLLPLPIGNSLPLQIGVANRIMRSYPKQLRTALGHQRTDGGRRRIRITTYVDAPAGSGLGTSSTLTVATLGAFVELLKLPLGEYDIAHVAYEIERNDLYMAGGKQDQYAATFGGINFMEFSANDKVIVNPLRIKREYLNELETNLLLYYTGTSRLSSQIIKAQSSKVIKGDVKSIEATKKLKEQAVLMKEALLTGRINQMGEILDFGWQYKKQMAESISNDIIEDIYTQAKRAGATGGKITGAGGGGFMMLYCPGTTKYSVMDRLSRFGGEFKRFMFTSDGLTTWSS